MTEKDIEKSILMFLERIPDSYVCKIDKGGKPVKKGNKTIIIPFGGRYSVVGMSDIMFICQGKTYFFEVKTPETVKYPRKHFDKLLVTHPDGHSRKVLIQQCRFIHSIRKAGAVGEFVASIEDVTTILQLNGILLR